MRTLETFNLADINTVKEIMNKLYELFKQILNPNLTKQEFEDYFFSQHPDSLEISFIYDEKNVAGFCTSSAYPRKLKGKKVIILRSAFGLLDDYKKGKFPLHGLFYKYIGYKLKHFFTPVYVAGFMANPLMYAMICKYTLNCYPRQNKKTPVRITELKNDLLDSMNLLNEEVSPFVVKIHFQVQFKEKDIQRFESSTDKHVNYFLSVNPGYEKQMGVMVLVPVTIPNMVFAFVKYMFRGLRKFFKRKYRKQNPC